MDIYKVYFDYEEEDSIEVFAPDAKTAKDLVFFDLKREHGWDEEEGMYDALNAELSLD